MSTFLSFTTNKAPVVLLVLIIAAIPVHGQWNPEGTGTGTLSFEGQKRFYQTVDSVRQKSGALSAIVKDSEKHDDLVAKLFASFQAKKPLTNKSRTAFLEIINSLAKTYPKLINQRATLDKSISTFDWLIDMSLTRPSEYLRQKPADEAPDPFKNMLDSLLLLPQMDINLDDWLQGRANLMTARETVEGALADLQLIKQREPEIRRYLDWLEFFKNGKEGMDGVFQAPTKPRLATGAKTDLFNPSGVTQ